MQKKQSFTLTELMIVVVIIGILASIAVPRYTRSVEKGRQGEAYSLLGAIRGLAINHYNETLGWATSLSQTDFEAPGYNGSAPGYSAKYFTYNILSPTTSGSLVARAIRRPVENPYTTYCIAIYLNGEYCAINIP